MGEQALQTLADLHERRYFIGGSDARTIMGDDEAALLRLWHEKRGEVEPEDLDSNIDTAKAWREPGRTGKRAMKSHTSAHFALARHPQPPDIIRRNPASSAGETDG